MGRLGGAGSNSAPKTNRLAASHPTDDPWIAHFSHPHHLELKSPDHQSLATLPICAGCNSRASGTAYYSCKPCNYVVDLSCAKMPRRVRHPAHPHSLNILAMKPLREGRPSDCGACGRSSAGFVFRCDPCGYDLHCQCAAKPLSVNHRAHEHALHLVFTPPYEDKLFSCDICGGGGKDHWLYRCAGECDFDAHIGCATAATVQVAASSRPPATKQETSSRPPPTTQKLQGSSTSPLTPREQRQRAGRQAASQPVTAPQQPRIRRPIAPVPQAAVRLAVPQQQGPLLPAQAAALQQQGQLRPTPAAALQQQGQLRPTPAAALQQQGPLWPLLAPGLQQQCLLGLQPQQGPLRPSPATGLQRPPPQSMRQRTRQALQQQPPPPPQQQPQGNQGNQGPDNSKVDQQNDEENTDEPDATEGGEDDDGDNTGDDYSNADADDQDGSSWVQSEECDDPESNGPNQDDGGDEEPDWTPNEDEGSSWMPNEDGGDCETNFMQNCSLEEADGSNFAMDCSFEGSDECFAENSYQE